MLARSVTAECLPNLVCDQAIALPDGWGEILGIHIGRIQDRLDYCKVTTSMPPSWVG